MSEEVEEGVIATSLSDDGFCARCITRFFGRYTDYDLQYIKEDDDYVVAAKKRKYGSSDELACRACCGILQDKFLKVNVLLNDGIKPALNYDCDNFVIFISIPLAILFRQHSVAYELKEKFPCYFTDEKIAQILPINKVWSLSIRHALEELLGKKYDKTSNLGIEFEVNFMANVIELKDLQMLQEEMEALKKPIVKLSKSHVEEFINIITPKVFREKFKYPAPARPLENVFVSSIACKHEPIFVAGRYCKYVRNMGQTPWVHDDVKVVKDSVQDFIFRTLEPFYEAEKLIFSASGREDFDVRTLGRGRPFYVRIVGPKRTKISFQQFRQMERDIEKCGVVKVKDLQYVSRLSLGSFKEGEEHKKKTYKALCVVDRDADLAAYVAKINVLNDLGPLKIEQATPVRVSHRRSLDTRTRKIYNMKASLIEGATDRFRLELVTQAGTYVKEFVHGDFDRTRPCLAQVVDGRVDILALDVMDIDLDFPPVISSEPIPIEPANFEIPSLISTPSEAVLERQSETPMELELPEGTFEENNEAPIDFSMHNSETPLDYSLPATEDEGGPSELMRAIRQETHKVVAEYLQIATRKVQN